MFGENRMGTQIPRPVGTTIDSSGYGGISSKRRNGRSGALDSVTTASGETEKLKGDW